MKCHSKPIADAIAAWRRSIGLNRYAFESWLRDSGIPVGHRTSEAWEQGRVNPRSDTLLAMVRLGLDLDMVQVHRIGS